MDTRLSSLPGIADLFRVRYCDGDHTLCARHRLADIVGVNGVPESLMPNDHDSAAKLARGYTIPN
jgi:hypothetical protein